MLKALVLLSTILLSESDDAKIQPVEVVKTGDYSEGVVLDYDGSLYFSHDKVITVVKPDGMCLDAAGNLYVAHYGMRQVQVLDPSGKLIHRYPAGNLTTSNVAFGGPKLDQLFVTGGDPGALFRLDVGAKGLDIRPKK